MTGQSPAPQAALPRTQPSFADTKVIERGVKSGGMVAAVAVADATGDGEGLAAGLGDAL